MVIQTQKKESHVFSFMWTLALDLQICMFNLPVETRKLESSCFWVGWVDLNGGEIVYWEPYDLA